MTLAANIDKKAGRFVPILVAAALSSLATTWALKTPETSRKAAMLPAVQAQAKKVPHLLDVAGCQTARARVATELVKDSEHGRDVDLSDIPNCPTLKPTKKAAAQPTSVYENVPKLPS